MAAAPYKVRATVQLSSDVETDADPVPGSFVSEQVRPSPSSQPTDAKEKNASPCTTMLVNGEHDNIAEHSGYYHSDPTPVSAGAVAFGGSSREWGQGTSFSTVHPSLPDEQNGAISCPDARVPVQISSPSSQQAARPTWESRNLPAGHQVSAVKEEGKPSYFIPTEEEDSERAKSASLPPYPSEERGSDSSGPDLEDDDDVEYYDYFLVFSEKDKKHAHKIMDLLKSHKLKGCLLEKDFPAGVSPFKNIADAIERSTYTVLVLTENFTKDRWCEKKLQTSLMEAIENPGKYNCVIPIIPHPDLMPRKKIPSELRTVSQLDMMSDYFPDKIKKTFKTKEREKRERKMSKSRREVTRKPLRSVCSVPSSLSSKTDFESLSAGKSSQSLSQLDRRYSSPVDGGKGKSTEEKSQTCEATRHAASNVQYLRGSARASIQNKKDAESTSGNRSHSSGKAGFNSVLEQESARNQQAHEAEPCHLLDSTHRTPQQPSAAHQQTRALRVPPADSYNPQAAVTLPASNQHDAGISAKAEPQAAGEVGGFVWVERCDRPSANSDSSGDISLAPGIHNNVGTNQGKSSKDRDLENQTSVLSNNKMGFPPSSQPLTDPSVPASAADSPWRKRDGSPDQTPGETDIPRAGDCQTPGVGNIPVITCQPPVVLPPQPYQVTNVYNIYSPKNIQIGNQNAMEKDDIVTDAGPGFDQQPVYYVPPMPYPPNMAAAPTHGASPGGQGQEKTSGDKARKMNEEYDIDDETDVKVPVEPEFDLDDETHVKIPVKPRMLSPAEIARSESCSSADEAQEEPCVMSALAEDTAAESFSTIDGETCVKEVLLQDLPTGDEESMASGTSVPKQRNFFSFLSRGKKK
ncbi:PREDICTED: uncharacterized protein LOC109477705 [Branchiostoma belcheri]|uniref:Uncharacterized protein LOC109477705 n=1 Tax=Branchiostoma belcheri TaxID=7741 RepID=A0A6P4YZ75_BRABE|nr:PREDICTED: uncharacterized protein LOC109477705 [Branchiostoma belcheri]